MQRLAELPGARINRARRAALLFGILCTACTAPTSTRLAQPSDSATASPTTSSQPAQTSSSSAPTPRKTAVQDNHQPIRAPSGGGTSSGRTDSACQLPRPGAYTARLTGNVTNGGQLERSYPGETTLTVDKPQIGKAGGREGAAVTTHLSEGDGRGEDNIYLHGDCDVYWFETSTTNDSKTQGGVRFSPPILLVPRAPAPGKSWTGNFKFDGGEGSYSLTIRGREEIAIGGRRFPAWIETGFVRWDVKSATTPFTVRIEIREQAFVPELGLWSRSRTVTTSHAAYGDLVSDRAFDLLSPEPG